MGKEGESAEKSDDESTPQEEPKPETQESEDEGEAKEVKAEEPKPVEEKKEEGEKKDKADELRKVIKVDQKNDEQPADGEPDTRENLEQKRAILQSIKDFDFQIKKNQEEITSVNQKLDSVTKDLDDLVSLYEIVSEQMNPFVGLSKVTKKRIDALENFTKEIDDLKNRMGDIESFAVRAGADLKTISEKREERKEKTINEKIEDAVDEEGKIDSEDTSEEIPVDETNEEINMEESQIVKSEPEPVFDNETVELSYDSYDYLDEIIEKSLKMMSLDSQMDRVIDEFIENLKA